MPCDLDENICPSGRVELFLSNRLAWEMYQKVSGQVIVAGMGDVLCVKFEAIQFILEIYMIDDPILKLDIFEKILIIDSVRMTSRKNSIQANMKKPKKK